MGKTLFIGTVREDAKLGSDFLPCGGGSTRDRFYIEKHSFDCGWYWGFGCIGNRALHTHFNSVFLNGAECDIEKLFIVPKYNQDQWWKIRDLFIQAYALSKCAEIYKHGGHQTSTRYGVAQEGNRGEQKAAQINTDLENVLNELWQELNKQL